MVITRIFTDDAGDPQFEQIQVSLTGKGKIGSLSDAFPVDSLTFRTTGENYHFHVAPARQFIVLPDGEIEIVTSIGEKRTFRRGDIVLAEDITGKGHKTRQLNPGIRKSIFITLKPQEK